MILNLIHFNKHKRIYYVPGMFSLLAIPLVFAIYGVDYLKENDYRVVSLNMPPKDFFQTEEWEFYKDFEYKDVTVPVSFSNDVENQFYNLIKELQKENIDKTGIKFQLSDANTYDDIIKLLDLMEITEQGRYLINFNDNSFYVLHIKKEGNSGMDDILVMTCYVGSPKKTFYEKIQLQINELNEKINNREFLWITSFLLLVVISFFRPKIFIPFSSKN